MTSEYKITYSILAATEKGMCMAPVSSVESEDWDVCGKRSPFSWRIETMYPDGRRTVRRNGAACWRHMPRQKRKIAAALGWSEGVEP